MNILVQGWSPHSLSRRALLHVGTTAADMSAPGIIILLQLLTNQKIKTCLHSAPEVIMTNQKTMKRREVRQMQRQRPGCICSNHSHSAKEVWQNKDKDRPAPRISACIQQKTKEGLSLCYSPLKVSSGIALRKLNEQKDIFTIWENFVKVSDGCCYYSHNGSCDCVIRILYPVRGVILIQCHVHTCPSQRQLHQWTVTWWSGSSFLVDWGQFGTGLNLAPNPIWHWTQFGTGPIWHQERKRVNLAPDPIWH